MTEHHDTVSETMTEIELPGIVEPDGVVTRRRAVPTPGDGEVLLRMEATGVSFADNAMRRGRYPGQPRFPFVLGYDVVGTVTAAGPGAPADLVGRRVAAVVKTGGWSTHLVLDARHVMPVSSSLDPAEVESLLVNGITAWQMLHRSAGVRRGQTVLVHGASGGVGLALVQLARHAGIRVIGTGSLRHHDLLRSLGAEPIDYRDPALVEKVRALAPDGVSAVFDNIGVDSFTRSFAQLAPGGTLVAYGTASQLDDTNNMVMAFVSILARFTWWGARPNRGRSATFYNFWAGKLVRPRRFRSRMAEDLDAVLALLADGTVTAHVGARLPLAEAGRALELAGSGTTTGKVVLVP